MCFINIAQPKKKGDNQKVSKLELVLFSGDMDGQLRRERHINGLIEGILGVGRWE